MNLLTGVFFALFSTVSEENYRNSEMEQELEAEVRAGWETHGTKIVA
jgi:hypothetical protein